MTDAKHDPARPERTPLEELRDWEVLQRNDEMEDQTERLKIPGGWLYRTTLATSLALVYVPDRS